jgi:hypothetical protein
MASLLSETHLDYTPKNVCVGVNNRGAVNLTRSNMLQNGFCTKHMDVWLPFFCELITNVLIKLNHIQTFNNYADFLTKPTGCTVIQRALCAIGVAKPLSSASILADQSIPACQIITNADDRAKRQCRGYASCNVKTRKLQSTLFYLHPIGIMPYPNQDQPNRYPFYQNR